MECQNGTLIKEVIPLLELFLSCYWRMEHFKEVIPLLEFFFSCHKNGTLEELFWSCHWRIEHLIKEVILLLEFIFLYLKKEIVSWSHFTVNCLLTFFISSIISSILTCFKYALNYYQAIIFCQVMNIYMPKYDEKHVLGAKCQIW